MHAQKPPLKGRLIQKPASAIELHAALRSVIPSIELQALLVLADVSRHAIVSPSHSEIFLSRLAELGPVEQRTALVLWLSDSSGGIRHSSTDGRR